MNTTLFSIGHGNKKAEFFLDELKRFNIDYLVDVRSKPYSKFNTHFNQNDLNYFLKQNNIKYLFLGDLIGGLPNDKSCYDENGKVDYLVLKDKNFFIKGLNRLITANNKQLQVAIMCSETNPIECHRSKLIGKALLKHDIDIKHIINKNSYKTQSALNRDLFGLFADNDDFHLSSKKSYI